MNNPQPGYGHVKSGDISSWARGRSSFVRPEVADKPATPVKVKGRLSPVIYPSRPVKHDPRSVVLPYETEVKRSTADIERVIEITSKFDALYAAKAAEGKPNISNHPTP